VGVENIRRKSMRQTARLIELAEEAGFKVNTPRDPAQRGGTVTLEPDPTCSYEISRELLARNILVDYRPQAGIRLSPHFYNSDEELYQAIDAIKDILADGSWQRHATGRAFVT
jgi:kynureninase